MDIIANQDYLKNNQYRQPYNLNARQEIHRRFSTTRIPWFQWVYDRQELSDQSRVLEVGCGNGGLWVNNRDRLPPGARFWLSDLSLGMVSQSTETLKAGGLFDFLLADAQDLPFAAGGFDRVVANHMLYHVPDLARAAASLSRVLLVGGMLMAATNGFIHMRDLHSLVRSIYPDYPVENYTAERFGLENGPDFLRPHFSRVSMEEFPDSLWVTESQPLVDYVQSLWRAPSEPDTARRLHDLFEREIARHGGVVIRKSSGVIRAWK